MRTSRLVVLLAAAACACSAPPPPRPPVPRPVVVRQGELVVDLDEVMVQTLDQLFQVEVEVAAVTTKGRTLLARRTGCAVHTWDEQHEALVTARRLVRPEEYEPALAAEVEARRKRGEVVEIRCRFTDLAEPSRVFAWPAPPELGPVRGLDLGAESLEGSPAGDGRRDLVSFRLRGVRRPFGGYAISFGDDELREGDRVLVLGGSGARPVRAVAAVGSDGSLRLTTTAPEGALLGAPVVPLNGRLLDAVPIALVAEERGSELVVGRLDEVQGGTDAPVGRPVRKDGEQAKPPSVRGHVQGAGEALLADVHAYTTSVHPDTWLGSCMVLDQDRAFELPRAPEGPTLLVVEGPDGVRLHGPVAVGLDEDDIVLRLDAAALSLLSRSPAVRRERARRAHEALPEHETRGHAEPGRAPSWVTVEGQSASRARAAEGDLTLEPAPRWFRLGWGPPARADDLPTDVDGSRLELTARADRSQELVLDVVLHAGPRGLHLQWEQRVGNLVPLLLAFEAAGEALVLDDRSYGRRGGSRGVSELVAPGRTERWSLRLDSASVDRIAPRPFPARLSVVVAFCEVLHHPTFVTERHMPPPVALDVGLPVVPPALFRSQRVDLVRGPDGWRPAE